MFSRTFLGNIIDCRTEAEISDHSGRLVAILYEGETGWHCEQTPQSIDNPREFEDFVEAVKVDLSRYVNRRGINPPPELTGVGLSMWLMEKDNGTALDRHVR